MYSTKYGVTIGDDWEQLAKKMAPIDLISISKAMKAIDKNGGVPKILKNIEQTK